jgi:ubiquinone/menaquinone biosynthesis C-methylase UbiE
MNINDNQKTFWNNQANDLTLNSESNIHLLDSLVNSENTILDYGCGYGRIMEVLYKRGFSNIQGIDISEDMIKRASELLPFLQFDICDCSEKLPFDDNSFDVVIIVDVIVSIIEDAVQDTIFKEISRCLKKNGIIFITDFLLSADIRNIKRYNQFEKKYDSYGTFETQQGLIARHSSLDRIKKITSEYNELHFSVFERKTINLNITEGFTYVGRK